jgi:hypothetical protein
MELDRRRLDFPIRVQRYRFVVCGQWPTAELPRGGEWGGFFARQGGAGRGGGKFENLHSVIPLPKHL